MSNNKKNNVLPIVGLVLVAPMLFFAILLLFYGITLVGTYIEAIWMLLGGAALLAVSIIVSRFSVKKLKQGTQENKGPFFGLIVSIVALCIGSFGILTAFALAEGGLLIALLVIFAILAVASVVGIVLSAIMIKKQSHS